MNETELNTLTLEEQLLALFSERPLDDCIDALEGAFRRRAADTDDPTDADFYRNTATELRELKERDFELSEEAGFSVQ